ncbi:MAG: MFS transporter [Chloroflexi bacterium]|nr:MFS transporter [Chloroflexota bacterium]
MAEYLVVWLGQTVSVLGTSMTTFAMTIWAWDKTGRVAPLAFIIAAGFITYLLLTPIAGVVVDRYDRKRVMLIADLGAALVSLFIYLLFVSGRLEVWHLYITTFVVGGLEAFHLPAYVTTATILLPKEEYGRAAGMRSFSFSLANLVAPPLAGLLIGWIGIGGIVIIDLITFALASLLLAFVHVPAPEQITPPPKFSLTEMFFGFDYIRRRPELLSLQATLTVTNFFAAFTAYAILSAFILARTAGDEVTLGVIRVAVAAGSLAGGAFASLWGGPTSKKARTILLALAAGFFFNNVLFGLGKGVLWWSGTLFLGAMMTPVLVSAFYGLWQALIPAALQGRVFAARDILVDLPVLLGTLLAGPLADTVFEPALLPGGRMAGLFGGLFGRILIALSPVSPAAIALSWTI